MTTKTIEPEPTLVTDLSTLRPGDVIEIRQGDITTRGPVGKIQTVSDGETTRVDRITTPDGQTLWSGLFLSLRGSEVYLVSTAKPPLPATPGSVLTRAVIRGEEVEGPIIRDIHGGVPQGQDPVTSADCDMVGQ